MGGMCDTAITASSEEEMMQKGMQHLEEAHPEMAASVKAMPADDPLMIDWVEKFKATYAAASEM